MRWFTVVNFFESLRPVYVASKIFLVHFETVDFENRTYRRTLSDQLRYVLSLIVDLYLTLVGIRSSAAFLHLSESVLLNVGYYGSLLLTFIFTLILPTWNSLEAGTIFAVIESIACFDDEIKLLGFGINHQKHHFVNTISTTPEKDRQTLTDTVQCCKMIRDFATLHGQLCDTIKLFNRCFSAQAIISLASCFGFTVFSIFGMIHSYATTVDENTLHLTWSTMIYDGFCIAFIIQLVVFSSLIHAECKRTSLLIHKIICYGSCDRNVRKELRIFSQQLSHHSPKISCGLFDFDWILFYTISGSLSTYLIILMQFDLINFDYTELTDKKKAVHQ
ncbi:putative gustatory receptor 28b [Topomyia yanbarensis]|uniref:putative gustatory receptor 28b n=1 Tax=Topomyia yanbarensis TaxID=2498891 RepID=UPI00273B31E2|nr:putative gustatory receptor 28b [Topomyia yanbarensis]